MPNLLLLVVDCESISGPVAGLLYDGHHVRDLSATMVWPKGAGPKVGLKKSVFVVAPACERRQWFQSKDQNRSSIKNFIRPATEWLDLPSYTQNGYVIDNWLRPIYMVNPSL